MATTVLDIVTGALQLLEVRVAESGVTSAEGVDGLAALNDMMNEWNVDGIDVGYETLDDTADEIFVDLGSIGAMKAGLAIYIAPEYGKTPSLILERRARRSKNSLRASIAINPSQLPDTLPVGSGNEDNNFVADGDAPGNVRSSRFFPSNVRRQCN